MSNILRMTYVGYSAYMKLLFGRLNTSVNRYIDIFINCMTRKFKGKNEEKVYFIHSYIGISNPVYNSLSRRA